MNEKVFRSTSSYTDALEYNNNNNYYILNKNIRF